MARIVVYAPVNHTVAMEMQGASKTYRAEKGEADDGEKEDISSPDKSVEKVC